MATRSDTSSTETPRQVPPPGPGWSRSIKQLLGIFGAIAIFLGLFILFAGDNQSLGFWDSTWQVGDIPEWWGYGMLIGGGVLWAAALAWILRGRSRTI